MGLKLFTNEHIKVHQGRRPITYTMNKDKRRLGGAKKYRGQGR